jgi:hypothetical protein
MPSGLLSASCSLWNLTCMLGYSILSWKAVIVVERKVVVVSRGDLPCVTHQGNVSNQLHFYTVIWLQCEANTLDLT